MVKYAPRRRSCKCRRSTSRTRGSFKRLRSYSRGRRGAARPRRALRSGYKGVPNQYRFIRETLPRTIDVGNPTLPYGQLLSGPIGTQNIAMLTFASFQMSNLVDFTQDFSNLFTSYKLDKLEVFMVPMWTSTPQQVYDLGTGGNALPNLAVTRVNSKYVLNHTVPTDALDAREMIAQLQMKTRSMYASKRWLKISTLNPSIVTEVLSGVTPTDTNTAIKRGGWMSISQAADQTFLFNSRCFLDRVDGNSFPGGPTVYLYKFWYKAHFRVSRVK